METNAAEPTNFRDFIDCAIDSIICHDFSIISYLQSLTIFDPLTQQNISPLHIFEVIISIPFFYIDNLSVLLNVLIMDFFF